MGECTRAAWCCTVVYTSRYQINKRVCYNIINIIKMITCRSEHTNLWHGFKHLWPHASVLPHNSPQDTLTMWHMILLRMVLPQLQGFLTSSIQGGHTSWLWHGWRTEQRKSKIKFQKPNLQWMIGTNQGESKCVHVYILDGTPGAWCRME